MSRKLSCSRVALLLVSKLFLLSGLLLSGLLLSGCQVKKVEMDEDVWVDFVRSLDFRREYAMRRTPTDVVYLRRGLKDASALIRYNAAQDLLRMGSEATEATPELIGCVESKPKKVAALCAKSLNTLSPFPDIAIVSLLPKVGQRFSSSSNFAKGLLGKIEYKDVAYDSEEAQIITTSLSSPLAAQSAEAARLAGLKGLDPLQASIQKLLTDKRSEVRHGAAIGLSYFAKRGVALPEEQITKELKAALLIAKGPRRSEIARLLGITDVAPKKAVTANKLDEGQSDAEKVPRALNVKETGKEMPKNDSMFAVRVSQVVVRRMSLRRLEKREPERLQKWRRQLPFLKTAIRSGSRAEQVAAVRVLGAMADYLPDAIPLLLQALASPESEVRERAAKLLGEHRVEQAVGPILGLLAESEIRQSAAVALLRIGTPEATREAAKYISNSELQKISAQQEVLRGEDNLPAGGVRQLCERELVRLGFKARNLRILSKECVQASGAYY